MSQPKRYFLKISQTISGLRCETYEDKDGEYVDYSAYAALQAENAVLTAKVDWLMKAEHLLIWDGKQWNIRPEHLPR